MQRVGDGYAPGGVLFVPLGDAPVHQLAVFPVGADEQHQKPVPAVLGEGVAPAQALLDGAAQLGSGSGNLLVVLQGVVPAVGEPVEQQIGALAAALDHPAAHAVRISVPRLPGSLMPSSINAHSP